MEKYKIEKDSVQETLIIPLYGRRLCSQRFPGLYQDSTAAMLMEKVDYDTEDIPIRGEHPWSIPVPDIEVELLSPSDGIGESEIGANFIIR